tara:strand:- start:536 stop:2773 length:2238 start_codon:yes stop_codon:yes gene_type:complete
VSRNHQAQTKQSAFFEAVARVKSGGALKVLGMIDQPNFEAAGDQQWLFIKALCLTFLGRMAEALVIWEQLIAQDQWSEEAILQAANCHLSLAEPERAQHILEIARSSDEAWQEDAVSVLWAETLLHPDNPQSTEPLVSQLRSANKPLTPLSSLLLLRALVNNKDWEAASAQLSGKLNENSSPTLADLSAFLKNHGAVAEAVAALKAFVSQSESLLEHHLDLIDLERALGDTDRIQHALADAAEQFPDALDITRAIIDQCLSSDDIAMAAAWFGELEAKWDSERIEELKPLATMIQLALDDLLAVEETLNEADESDERFDQARVAFYSKVNQTEVALHYQERMAASERSSIHGLMSIARLSLQTGDTNRAVNHAKSVLKVAPQHLGATAILIESHGKAAELSLIQRLQCEALDFRAPARQRAWIKHCLAGYHHAIGDFTTASTLYQDSNELAQAAEPSGYRRDSHSAQCLEIREAFHPDATGHLIAEPGNEPPEPCVPVFIVGVPRSGTTLTEQILARHSRCIGMGERPYASKSLAWLRAMQSHSSQPLGDALLNASKAQLHELRQNYYELLKPHYRHYQASEPPFVIDKMPDNYQHIGWLKLLFPEAKIIYAKRDPKEIALSCWRANFGSIKWAFDPTDIGHRIAEHMSLMSFWMAHDGHHMLVSDYRDLVRNPREQAERLLNFLGLDWEDACLDHTKNQSVVATASLRQVRQPIYTSSLDMWQQYQSSLAPAFEQFERLASGPK